MAALIFDIQVYGTATWVDVSDRQASDAVLTEGRDAAAMGGPTPTPRPSVLTMNLDNADGALNTLVAPGNRLRVRWGAQSATTTRFIGRLASGPGADILVTEWFGELAKFTAAAEGGRERLYIEKSITAIFGQTAESVGISPGRYAADVDSIPYSLLVRSGVQGLQDIEDASGGFVYDTSVGAARLELPATRAAKVVTQRYTDIAAAAGEVGIARPEKLTQMFGVINRAEAQLRAYSPKSALPETRTYTIRSAIFVRAGYSDTACIDIDTGGLLALPTIISHTLKITYTTVTDQGPISGESASTTGGSLTWNVALGSDTGLVVLTNIATRHDGTAVTLCFSHTGNLNRVGIGALGVIFGIEGTITVANEHGFDYDTLVFSEYADDQASQKRYGTRPRSAPIVVGTAAVEPLPSTYTPPPAVRFSLEAAAALELEQYRTPIPIYLASHSDEAATLARRLSDKEHLRLRDGFDSDVFVEALETRLRTPPRVLQRVYYAQARVRAPISFQPSVPVNRLRFDQLTLLGRLPLPNTFYAAPGSGRTWTNGAGGGLVGSSFYFTMNEQPGRSGRPRYGNYTAWRIPLGDDPTAWATAVPVSLGVVGTTTYDNARNRISGNRVFNLFTHAGRIFTNTWFSEPTHGDDFHQIFEVNAQTIARTMLTNFEGYGAYDRGVAILPLQDAGQDTSELLGYTDATQPVGNILLEGVADLFSTAVPHTSYLGDARTIVEGASSQVLFWDALTEELVLGRQTTWTSVSDITTDNSPEHDLGPGSNAFDPLAIVEHPTLGLLLITRSGPSTDVDFPAYVYSIPRST